LQFAFAAHKLIQLIAIIDPLWEESHRKLGTWQEKRTANARASETASRMRWGHCISRSRCGAGMLSFADRRNLW